MRQASFAVARAPAGRSLKGKPGLGAWWRERLAAAAIAVWRRPGLVLTGVAVSGAFGAVGWNALVRQTTPHPAPLFARVSPDAARRPEPVPAPPAKPDFAAAATSARPGADVPPRASTSADPIGALIRSGDPAPRPTDAKPAASSRVTSAQKALVKLGYGPIDPDGVFGGATRQAVERFERDRNLPVTGALGPKTARQLAALTGIRLD